MSPIGPKSPLADIKPGIYWLIAPEGTLAPRGVVRVIMDERGFPTIWIDEQKYWPISMLPEGTELAMRAPSVVGVGGEGEEGEDAQRRAEDAQGDDEGKPELEQHG